MTISQVLNHVKDNIYDDNITVTDIPQGFFITVAGNSIAEGSSMREIKVELSKLNFPKGGTMLTNPGEFERQPNETSVKVIVTQNGENLVENVVNY